MGIVKGLAYLLGTAAVAGATAAERDSNTVLENAARRVKILGRTATVQ